MVRLGEGSGDEGGEHPTAALASMCKSVALEVDAAAPPGGGEHPRSRGLDTLMRVADHQLHAAEATAHEIAEEVGPERLSLRGADRHAQDFPPPVGVHAHGDGDG